MDQTLELKLEEFKKALATLEEALALPYDKVVRDSAIKRFEYTFELAWKTVKVFLEQRFGIEAASPKECFRELRNNAALTDEGVAELLRMTDDRNEVIHTYKEAFADELYKAIASKYAPMLQKVYEVTGEKINS